MSYQNQVLGTIISSVLNYDQLCKVMQENPAIDNQNSSYVPCDGRNIEHSKLSELTGTLTVPDLRGRFLRGLNTIYSPGQPALVITSADEDDPNSNRKAGDYQADMLKLHPHTASGHINGSVCGSNGTHDVDGGDEKWNCDPNFGDHNVVVSVQPFGGSETRPKNVSVYFYIKIN
ncbi:hypothetical protein BEL04_19300 [Mucilaginibacter sp. PPCGB 2223]|uniref:hypothetical protein n=1 Tax=Mucilaginibacter sp. PPCGB 2223 TaxID=1886027 RepID=UPI0008251E2A|nr:hypothetical protein [Mucilaginibacter sp. PPCGB 2223]OCX50873.1 hypothetical protein BEL04_19300 [Mucilaginibacter sp. PPCGB 2223]